MDIRVVIIATDPLVRSALSAELADQPGIEVVGQMAPATEPITEAALFRPDVLVWDLGWDTDSGSLDLLVDSLAEGDYDTLPTIALVPNAEQGGLVFASGVQSILLRDAEPEKLIAALNATVTGLTVLDSLIAAELQPEEVSSIDALAEPLTPREVEVLELVAEGMSNRSIAYQLGISDSTVKFHLNSLLSKLNAQSRTEAVVRAMRLGIISL